MTLPDGAFAGRLDAALRKRLFPRTALTPKQLAGAVGVAPDTIARYQRGDTRAFAENLYAIHQFFSKAGDAGFAREVFGIEETPASLGREFWILADGTIHFAPFGRARFASERQGLSPRVAGDHAAAAMRSLGWISLTEEPGGLVILRYHAAGISRNAASRASGWLADRACQVSAVSRIVTIEERDGSSRTVKVNRESAMEAAQAVELAAGLAHVPPPLPWRNERLSLDTLAHPSAQRLARVFNASPWRLVQAAAEEKILPECSLLRVSNDRVDSVLIGDKHPMAPDIRAKFIGTPLMARSDIRYAELTSADFIEASREGPTYRQPHGTICGQPAKYRRAIFPCGNGLFLSHTEALAA